VSACAFCQTKSFLKSLIRQPRKLVTTNLGGAGATTVIIRTQVFAEHC